MAVPSREMTKAQAAQLGEEIRRLRLPATQAQLAEGRDFSSEWLSKLESGRIEKVSIGKLAALSEALGYPSDALARFIDGADLPGRRQPDPDALREGHGGTEGWPEWLEDWLRQEISSVRDAVAEVTRRVGDLEHRVKDPPA